MADPAGLSETRPAALSAKAPGRRVDVQIAARGALTPRTAKRLLLGLGGLTFAVAAPFALSGFWPVAAFAVLEIAGLSCALWASMRASAERETIIVTNDSITILHHGCDGERSAVFPRHWSRVTLRAPSAALHPCRLVIESHGCACEVGRFLTEDERRTLAVRLKQLVGNVNESPAL